MIYSATALHNDKEGPGMHCWVINKTSNDELYKFNRQCLVKDYHEALVPLYGLNYHAHAVVKLSDLEGDTQ